MSIRKYSVIDLNGDSSPEMVLWLDHGASTDYGFLILHSDGATVYAYSLVYRAFYTLKTDGTFHFSGGASDNGIGMIDFTGDTYIINKIAYCETVYDEQEESQFSENKSVQYFIENNNVSEDEYNIFMNEQDNKQDITWYEYIV
ncbi:MAG: hypothetical protein PUB34_08140 [Clostridia bacterium]|nr:hypothetical protein [Clostridia bacterium]